MIRMNDAVQNHLALPKLSQGNRPLKMAAQKKEEAALGRGLEGELRMDDAENH